MDKVPGRRKITNRPPVPQDLFVSHTQEVENVIRKAVRDALRVHKRLGNPVATVRNGKVVLVPPKDIPVDVD
jgi:hypothetical protein